MPNADFQQKAASKLERAFARLAACCQFTPDEGEPFIRLVDLPQSQLDTSQEYVPQPVTTAEFLLSQGTVNQGDLFQIGILDDEGQFQPRSKQCRLNQIYHVDNLSVTYIFVEL